MWVATTTNAADDPIVDLCSALDTPVFRGDEADVLGRYAGAAAAANATVIVRLTADCPLMDPALIDQAIDFYDAEGCDYASNAINLSYPDGLDIEVFSAAVLDRANREANLPFHREHVTPYMRTDVYDNIPTGDFKVGQMRAPADFSHLRWTVDTAEDLERVRAFALELPADHGWMDVLSLLTRQPGLLSAGSKTAPDIAIRQATSDDADILLEWVNQPSSLANKLMTETPITPKSHASWLHEKLAGNTSGIWIAENDDGPVGQVRLDLRDAALEVDIYVDPACRGQGAGAALLTAVRIEAAKRWSGVSLIARVKPDNWASRRLFAKSGYGRTLVAPDHLIMYRDPIKPGANTA